MPVSSDTLLGVVAFIEEVLAHPDIRTHLDADDLFLGVHLLSQIKGQPHGFVDADLRVIVAARLERRREGGS